MDLEPEELQFLGFLGVCREAHNLILSRRRLFSQIGSALVLPLAFLSLAHIFASHLLFATISRSESALDSAPAGSASETRILSRLASEYTAAALFKALYLLALLVFSLLCTAAAVYTVASIYTAKDLSFPKVLAVVPKVWKRLIVTFLYAFLLLLAYHLAAFLLTVLLVVLLGTGAVALVFLTFFVLFYIAGLVWISVVWHVASVVSVLEEAGGMAAMKKSRELVKGKMRTTVGVFLVLNSAFVGIEVGFRKLVVQEGGHLGPAARVAIGAAMLLMLSVVMLVGLVAQTVIYFVCKSYHHESIDKSSLADHLEVYHDDYVPLKGRDVQLEQYYV